MAESSGAVTELPVIETETAEVAPVDPPSRPANFPSETTPGKTDKDAVLNPINDVPPDRVNLRLLLLSGRKTDLLVLPTASIEAVRGQIYQNWPSSWDEKPKDVKSIRILYRGKFLEGGFTVECGSDRWESVILHSFNSDYPTAQKIPVGQTTVIHVVLKQFENVEPSGTFALNVTNFPLS